MPANPTQATPDSDPLTICQNLCMTGIALAAEGHLDDALRHYESVITQFSARRKIEFTQIVATAMFNKGAALTKLNQSAEAVAAYSALIDRKSVV